MSNLSAPSSSVLEAVREAYQRLAEGEKAKIMRFTARHRFTDDNFENWLDQSGLLHGDLRREMIAERQLPPVREKLDTTLLSNQGLMQDTITKYLAQGNPDLLNAVIEWVRAERGKLAPNPPETVREVVEANHAPENLATNPQYQFVCAVMKAHWLDHKLVEMAGNEPEETTVIETVEESMPVSDPVAESSPAPLAVATATAVGVIGAGTALSEQDSEMPADEILDETIDDDFDSSTTENPATTEVPVEEAPVLFQDSEDHSPLSANDSTTSHSSNPLMNKIESLQAFCDEIEAKLADMRTASKDVSVLGVLKPATEAFSLIEEIREEAAAKGSDASWTSVDELRSFADEKVDSPAEPSTPASPTATESSNARKAGAELLSSLGVDPAEEDTVEEEATQPETRSLFSKFM